MLKHNLGARRVVTACSSNYSIPKVKLCFQKDFFFHIVRQKFLDGKKLNAAADSAQLVLFIFEIVNLSTQIVWAIN